MEDILAQARNSEERQILQSAVEFLRQEGVKEGREEAREENRREGRKRGRQEGRVKVATNLLRDGMDPEKVAEVTDLNRDAVLSLQH